MQKPRFNRCAFAALAVLSCTAPRDARGQPTPAAAEVGITGKNANIRSPLDDPPPFFQGGPESPVTPAEYTMSAGRLHDIPISRFFHESHRVIGKHSFAARVTCLPDAEGGDPDPDPGLIIHIRRGAQSRSIFSSEAVCPLTCEEGLCADACTAPEHSAWVLVGPRSSSTTYDIYAFSQRRSTARCNVYTNTTGSTSQWTQIAGPVSIGGTLVYVGALAKPNDFLEVLTPTDGRIVVAGERRSDVNDTRMLLFDMGPAPSRCKSSTFNSCGSSNAPIVSLNGSAGDFDPRIRPVRSGRCTGPCPWANTENYVLLGKEESSAPTNKGVETRVHLVKGPLEDDYSAALTPEAESLALPPGTYLTYIQASIDEPVGSTARVQNPIDGFCTDEDPHQWIGESDTIPAVGPRYRRGRLGETNVLALALFKFEGSGWDFVSIREIERGAFGGSTTDGWERFAIPVDTSLHPKATKWQLRAFWDEGIKIHPTWHAVRNPDASELKMVTYNQMGDDLGSEGGDPSNAHFRRKLRNSAELFLGRGQILPLERRVVEAPDQARFQWDADILAMQEVMRPDCSDAGLNHDAPESVLKVAEDNGSSQWAYAFDWDEHWFWCVGRNPGLQTTHVRDSVNPDDGILMSPAAMDWASCLSSTGGSHAAGAALDGPQPGSCLVDECTACGDSFGDVETYSLPVRVAAQRGVGHSSFTPSADRPIVVFNYHPWHVGMANRKETLDDLIWHIKRLMQGDSQAFNKEPHEAGKTDDPRYAYQRFVIIGDYNFVSHACGEHYAVLRQLRDEFGYALDVSLAMEGAASHQLGQHDVGLGVTSAFTYVFDPGSNPLDPNSWTQYWKEMEFYPLGTRPGSGAYARSIAYPIEAADWVYGWEHPFHQPSPSAMSSGDDEGVASDGYARFPWWARTIRRKTSSDNRGQSRVDAILLVGKGWAYDDPVQTYRILWNSHKTIASMGALDTTGTGRADCVEQFNDGLPGACRDDSAASYRPTYNLNGGSQAPRRGDPALHSDHRPVGARIRVWTR